MSKKKSDFKNGKRQNQPYYLNQAKNNDMIKIDNKIKEKFEEKGKIEKFKFNRLKDDNVLLSIDGERPHIIFPKQLFALTLACIKLSKLVIPDCDFTKAIENNEFLDRFEKK